MFVRRDREGDDPVRKIGLREHEHIGDAPDPPDDPPEFLRVGRLADLLDHRSRVRVVLFHRIEEGAFRLIGRGIPKFPSGRPAVPEIPPNECQGLLSLNGVERRC